LIKINNTLKFLRNDLNEQKQEQSPCPIIDITEIWKIFDLTLKYQHLQNLKEFLLEVYKRMQSYQEKNIEYLQTKDTIENEEREQTKACLLVIIRDIELTDINNVKNSRSCEEIFDCRNHFNLYYVNDFLMFENSLYEQDRISKMFQIEEKNYIDAKTSEFINFNIQNDLYRRFKTAEMTKYVKKFVISPKLFGENLKEDYNRHGIEEQFVDDPSTIANNFIALLDSKTVTLEVDDVFYMFRYVACMELAHDPIVSNYVRKLYFKQVGINIVSMKNQGI
jgi:transcription elongation factor SPT6